MLPVAPENSSMIPISYTLLKFCSNERLLNFVYSVIQLMIRRLHLTQMTSSQISNRLMRGGGVELVLMGAMVSSLPITSNSSDLSVKFIFLSVLFSDIHWFHWVNTLRVVCAELLRDTFSILWIMFSSVEGYLRYTVEDAQYLAGIPSVYCGESVPSRDTFSILWSIFSTLEGYLQYCGGKP